MSKKRDLRRRSNPQFFNASLDERKLKNSFFGNDTIKSTYIPDSKIHRSSLNADFTYVNNEKVFNKNISHYRQSFNQNDPSQLPFMSSLRRGKKFRSVDMKAGTESRPFEAGQKTTANMRIKKKIADMSGKGIRMTNAYYRWHNKSGVNNKQGTEFECTLRDYNLSWAPNPEEEKFNNTIRPIKYQDTEEKMYKQTDLICPRQRRLFNIVA